MTPFEIYSLRSIKKNTTWLTFLFLGWSYGPMGQMGKQFLYYVTIGGLGVWTLYRLFTLNGEINEFNYNVAKEAGMSDGDVRRIGLKQPVVRDWFFFHKWAIITFGVSIILFLFFLGTMILVSISMILVSI